jgi:hypothetical protein
MAISTSKQTLGFDPWALSPRTCGPLGHNDAASPFSDLLGDTPGVCGVGDWADAGVVTTKAADQNRSPANKLPPATDDPSFTVPAGQVTFDAEGNDNPNSPYFSRQIQWPGNAASGVTIGRGYDIGNRTQEQVAADLEAAGLSSEQASAFAKGAGLKGPDADKFVKQNVKKLGLISPEVQKSLFDNIYPTYVQSARANYDEWTQDNPNRVSWAALSPAIRDVLVDFVYQGFTKGPRPMEAGMNNNAVALMNYINENAIMKKYEAGRRRVSYLKRFGSL